MEKHSFSPTPVESYLSTGVIRVHKDEHGYVIPPLFFSMREELSLSLKITKPRIRETKQLAQENTRTETQAQVCLKFSLYATLSRWWRGRPVMLRFMGSQRVGHDWATELNWTDWSESHSVMSDSRRSHGLYRILYGRILEWVVFPFFRGSSQLRDRTQVSHMAGGLFTSWATREVHTTLKRETILVLKITIKFAFYNS